MAPYLTDADLRVLAGIFAYAHMMRRMRDADYERTVIVLAAAKRQQKEVADARLG